MDLPSQTLKHASLALVVALLMTTAGCSAFAGSTGSDNATTTAEPATSEMTETATATTTATPETTASDGHSHSHGNETTSNTSDASSTDAAYTGQMAVVVAGERVDLTETESVNMSDMDSWHTNESVTLSQVLAEAGVDATESTLSYDGTTYDASENGTKVVYRVDSHAVDPAEYTLESGDEIWVLVVTDDMNVSTPTNHISPENLHVHGNIEFTVDGEEVDFSRDKYQQAGHNDYFHFEGGHADPWHAHSAYVTLGYGMSTLDGINVTDDGITYNETTYTFDGQGNTATVLVNGEPVDPNEYVLKDGDSVTIELESAD